MCTRQVGKLWRPHAGGSCRNCEYKCFLHLSFCANYNELNPAHPYFLIYRYIYIHIYIYVYIVGVFPRGLQFKSLDYCNWPRILFSLDPAPPSSRRFFGGVRLYGPSSLPSSLHLQGLRLGVGLRSGRRSLISTQTPLKYAELSPRSIVHNSKSKKREVLKSYTLRSQILQPRLWKCKILSSQA